MCQKVLVLTLTAGVGLLGCLGPRATPSPTGIEAIMDAVASACDGQAVVGAGLLDPSGSARNHLVMIDRSGQEAWTPSVGPLRHEWWPGTLADTELVACRGQRTQAVIEVCHYQALGSDITRMSLTENIAVFEAGSGRSVADFSVSGQPRECRQFEQADLTEIWGFPEWSDIQAHLVGLVERGTFEDPDPTEL